MIELNSTPTDEADVINVDKEDRLEREVTCWLAAKADIRVNKQAFTRALLWIEFDAPTTNIIQEENGFKTIDLLLEIGVKDITNFVNQIGEWNLFKSKDRSKSIKCLQFLSVCKFVAMWFWCYIQQYLRIKGWAADDFAKNKIKKTATHVDHEHSTLTQSNTKKLT